jgi:hypothetical protein
MLGNTLETTKLEKTHTSQKKKNTRCMFGSPHLAAKNLHAYDFYLFWHSLIAGGTNSGT